MRCARGAPAVDLEMAADAAGLTERRLAAVLRGLGRGRCDAFAAGAFTVGGLHQCVAVLKDVRCPPPVARLSGAHPFGDVRDAARGVAGWAGRSSHRTAAPRTSLARDASDTRPRYRSAPAGNPACGPLMLHRLLFDEAIDPQCDAAGNPAVSLVPLEALLRDEDRDWEVRKAAAGNASWPQDQLDRLAADSDPWMRAVLAAQADWRYASIVERLSDDPDSDVRVAAANNRWCAPEVLTKLAQDPDPEVRETAETTLAKLDA